MVGFEAKKPRTARSTAHPQGRVVKADVRISRGPWASESGSALADDVCRR